MMKKNMTVVAVTVIAAGLVWFLFSKRENQSMNALDHTAKEGQSVLGQPATISPERQAAFNQTLQAAEKGDVNAQTTVGVMYYEGDGVAMDRGLAVEWLKKAALQKHPGAQYALGVVYRDGTGAAKDRNEAIKQFSAAADAGSMPAKLALANLLVSEPATTQNGLKIYEAAVKEGSPQGMFDLGAYYLRKGERKKGCQLYQKSAEKDFPLGLFGLGLCFSEGDGWEKSPHKAFLHIEKAANAGLPEAQFMIGSMYAEGNGVPKDEGKAIEWYQKAAQRNNYLAQFNLARIYTEKGDDASYSQAFNLLSQAAAQGYAPAQYQLAILYGTGKGVPEDAGKALQWYERAASAQYAPAQYNLAIMYLRGEGTAKNEDLGSRWMQEAAKNGYEKAKEAVQQQNDKTHQH